jgi:hypothetical protein
MKDSHREPHRAGTLIRGRDAEVKHERKNHEVTGLLASQQAYHEAESAVASRPDVFQSLRL